MSEDVLAANAWPTNGHLIADVARLHYLDGTVLDATYGDGTFWREWKPTHLTTNDRYKSADHAWDYLDLPCRDAAFDCVVFDPPYKLNGTPVNDAQDKHFGTDRKRKVPEVMDELVRGAQECWRVAREHLLVKCQAQVALHRMWWQDEVVAQTIGLEHKVDEFHFLYTPRPQPGGRPQRHARRNYSTLLVFAR